jgi:hypothetical protein
MNNIEINKKSWHFRLANFYSWSKSSCNMTDLCTYIANVINGFFIVIIIIAVASFLVSSILLFLMSIYVVIMHSGTLSTLVPPKSEQLIYVLHLCGMSIVVLFLLSGAFYLIETLIKTTTLGFLRNGDRLINTISRTYTETVNKHELIRAVYDSIKNKVCYKIKFIEK